MFAQSALPQRTLYYLDYVQAPVGDPISVPTLYGYATSGTRTTAIPLASVASQQTGDLAGLLVLAPDASRAYVARLTDIAVIDLVANSIATTFRTGTAPRTLAISPDGSRLYVMDTGATAIRVLSASTGGLLASIDIGTQADAIAISTDGQWLAAKNTNGSVSAARLANGAIQTIAAAASINAVAISPDGAKIFAATNTTLMSIDRATSAVSTVAKPTNETGFFADVALSPSGTTLVAALSRFLGAGQGSVGGVYGLTVETSTWTLLEASVHEHAGSLAWSPDGLALAATGEVTLGSPTNTGGHAYALDPALPTIKPVGSTAIGRYIAGMAITNPSTCSPTFTPPPVLFINGSGPQTVAVPAGAGCAWTAVADDPWFTVSPASGTGPGNVVITGNGGGVARTGRLVVNRIDVPVVETRRGASIDGPAPGGRVTQPFILSGWAAEFWKTSLLYAPSNLSTGVTNVDVYAYRNFPNEPPVYIPLDVKRASRPDLAAAFGAEYALAGYATTVKGLAPGVYTFVAYARSAFNGQYTPKVLPNIRIDPAPPKIEAVLDLPRDGEVLPQPLVLAGWALDRNAASGTGVDTVHVWAWPTNGGAPTFAGVVTYGHSRPDLGTIFGSQFANSGFALAANTLPAGTYQLVAYVHSAFTGLFEAQTSRVVTVLAATMEPGATWLEGRTTSTLTLGGYAIDRRATTGVGIDTVHVWAYPATGAAPVFLGAATPSLARPELAALFGSQFTAGGWRLSAPALPSGTYTIVAYGHSTFSGAFDNVRTWVVVVP